MRVESCKKPHYNLANRAQQLPPKAEDGPLSFCTHKAKGHQGDPPARTERQSTGARAYQPRDSAVRVQINSPLAKAGSDVRALATLTRLKVNGLKHLKRGLSQAKYALQRTRERKKTNINNKTKA